VQGPVEKRCFLCGSKDRRLLQLRDRRHICQDCIEEREERIHDSSRKISCLYLEKRNPPKNLWDFIRLGAIGITVLACGHAWFHGVTTISIATAFAGMWGMDVSERQAHKGKLPFTRALESQIDDLYAVMVSLRAEVASIYAQYWPLPPDWQERRSQVMERDNNTCKSCGRKRLRSKVPFHVHHIVPRSHESGNHSLANLQLLCEICHSKLEGHELVRASRTERLRTGQWMCRVVSNTAAR